METLQSTFDYFLSNQSFFWDAAGEHLALSFSALGISLLPIFDPSYLLIS